MSNELNLSRRPFLNPRPVLRLTIFLWAAGAIFAALNVRLYWSHFTGSSETREQQQTLEASIEAENRRVNALETELNRFDLDWQNDQSSFLNSKIAERSFSWSQLFDLLGEVLPADVRVASLSPEFSRRGRRGRDDPGDHEVELGIAGIARDSAVLFEFIDALFGHPSFRDPDLTRENLKDTGLLDFNLSVIYQARAPEPQPETVEAAVEGAGDPAETAESDGGESSADESGATPAVQEDDTPAGSDAGETTTSATEADPS